jgi:Trypsin-co-occurring domain 1
MESSMKQFMSYETSGGHMVVVEVDESDHERGLSRASRSPGEVILRSQERLEEATGVIRSAGEVIVGQVRSLATPPDEVGCGVWAKAHVLGGRCHRGHRRGGQFKISLAWRHIGPTEG